MAVATEDSRRRFDVVSPRASRLSMRLSFAAASMSNTGRGDKNVTANADFAETKSSPLPGF
jgi:hypothetical protein